MSNELEKFKFIPLDIVVVYIRKACVIRPIAKEKLRKLPFEALLKNKIKPGIVYKTSEIRSNVKYSISIVCSKI
tara:strand:+ start:94 stop:315 length:222 start_codon:yes stop_codon:yes gene_type:complete